MELKFLECVVMGNGEIISLGKTIGWVRDFGEHLFTEKEILERSAENNG